jgi:hypothetical protein
MHARTVGRSDFAPLTACDQLALDDPPRSVNADPRPGFCRLEGLDVVGIFRAVRYASGMLVRGVENNRSTTIFLKRALPTGSRTEFLMPGSARHDAAARGTFDGIIAPFRRLAGGVIG